MLYMLVSPWHEVAIALNNYRLSKTKKKGRRKKYYPLVSVLIPAWNEEFGVVTTVEALLKSTYKNLEIIVIDNASTDRTSANIKKLIRKYKKQNPESFQVFPKQVSRPKPIVRYTYESKSGKGNALNHGLKVAHGEIIITIDADCYVPPDTIESFVLQFRDPKVMATVGNVKIGNIRTIIGIVQYLEFLFSFYFKRADSLVGVVYIIGGAAGAFRKEVFQKLGNFSTTNITEDIELSVRIQDAGMKIVYASDAIVYTEGASELKSLMKQRLRWKRGRIETFAEHKGLFFSAKSHHNKILSWFILPLAIFGEAQLSLEIFFLLFLYLYSFYTQDFTSFYSGIVVVSSMFFVQAIFDGNKTKGAYRFLLLAPIGWLLFYVSTFVEFTALVRAIWGYARGSELQWQKWKREGVFEAEALNRNETRRLDSR